MYGVDDGRRRGFAFCPQHSRQWRRPQHRPSRAARGAPGGAVQRLPRLAYLHFFSEKLPANGNGQGACPLFEGLVKQAVDEVLDRLAKMQHVKQLFMVDGFSLLRMGAIGERARTGLPLSEPYGSTRRFLDFNELMFLPVQLSRFPLERHQDVNTQVTVGPQAAEPLPLSTPIMVTGMAYGAALSKAAKWRSAKGSALAGTATNSGESGFLPEEREAAGKYIVQWNRGRWGNDLDDMRSVDAIEIQVGQGRRRRSAGNTIKAEKIREDFRAHLGLKPGQDASRPARFRDIEEPSQFRRLVDQACARRRAECPSD